MEKYWLPPQAKKTELFDPVLQKWIPGGDMIENHGPYMMLVLLQNGKVLATGGNNALQTAEIYDPLTNTWTKLTSRMVRPRTYHSGLVLKDGKVLITNTGENIYSKKVEIFDPATNTFSATTDLPTFAGPSTTVLLDNGHACLFGLGDLTTGNNILQFYNPDTKTWYSPPSTGIGALDYTVSRLPNGSFLFAGGNFSVGQSALANCFIMEQNGYSCTNTTSTVALASNNCIGKNSLISIPTSVLNYSYQGYIGSLPVTPKVSGNGAAIDLTIDSELAYYQRLLVTIMVTPPSCLTIPAYPAVSLVKNPVIPSPKLTSPDSVVCTGSSMMINASQNASYQLEWNNGQTSQVQAATKSSLYYARYKDGQGCYGPPSNLIRIYSLDTLIRPDAMYNQEFCISDPAIKLYGYPENGRWTGKGISPKGIFSPLEAGTGIHKIFLSNCKRKDSVLVSVESDNTPAIELRKYRDTLCLGKRINLTIKNSNPFLVYDYGYNKYTGTGKDLIIDTSYGGYTDNYTHSVKTTKTSVCTKNSATFTANYTVVRYRIAQQTILIPDSFCKNETVKVIIPESKKNLFYARSEGNYVDSLFKQGNGDTLNLFLRVDGSNTINIVARNDKGCPLEYLTGMTLKPKVLSTFISLIKPFYTPGEEITFLNSSNGDQHYWEFVDGSLKFSNEKWPRGLSYDSTGDFKVKYKTISRLGCTMNDSLNLIISRKPSEFPNKPCTVVEPGLIPDQRILDDARDSKDNIYTVGFSMRYNNTNYGQSPAYFIRKQGPSGVVIWTKEVNVDKYSPYGSSYITSISVDNSDMVYIGGSFNCQNFTLDGFNLNMRATTSYAPQTTMPFLAKLDENGTVLWAHTMTYKNTDLGNGAAVSDIEVKDNYLYVCHTELSNSYYSELPFYVSKYSLDGRLVKASPGQGAFWGSFSYFPPISTIYASHLTSLTPKMKVFTDNKISMIVSFKGQIKSQNMTIGEAGKMNNYFINFSIESGITDSLNIYKTISESDCRLSSYQPFLYDQRNNSYYMVLNDLFSNSTEPWKILKLKDRKTSLLLSGDNTLERLAANSSGDLFISGSFYNTLKFSYPDGKSERIEKPHFRIFLARLDSSGKIKYGNWEGGTSYNSYVLLDKCENTWLYYAGIKPENPANNLFNPVQIILPDKSCYGTCGPYVTKLEEAVIEKSAMHLFPNPAGSSIKLLPGSGSQNTGAILLDAQGIVLKTISHIPQSGIIDISYLVPGVYMFRVKDMEEKEISLRFIKL